MKKRLFLLTALPLMMTSLVGCGEKADFNIGVLQWVEIEALTKATNGFMDSFKEAIGNKTVKFDVKQAYGDANTAATALSSFVSTNRDLIMANATPSVVLASNATQSIPIVGTSVTTYSGAFNDGVIPNNVTGTSDLASLEDQAKMVFEWVSEATTIGILYCVNESNSKYQADQIKVELNKLKTGLSFEEIIFTNTEDLASQLTAKVNNLDVLYIPTDNTCADNADVIHNICKPANLPVITGEEGICRKCGIASLTIDYYRLGKVTGLMAKEILIDGKKPSELEIRYDEGASKVYNPLILQELGLSESDVPAGYNPIK